MKFAYYHSHENNSHLEKQQLLSVHLALSLV